MVAVPQDRLSRETVSSLLSGKHGTVHKDENPVVWSAWSGCHLCSSLGDQLSPALPCEGSLEAPVAGLLDMGRVGMGVERAGCLQPPERVAEERHEARRVWRRTCLRSCGRNWPGSNNDFLVSQ